MVNDQLLRVHQMKLLSVERMSPKSQSGVACPPEPPFTDEELQQDDNHHDNQPDPILIHEDTQEAVSPDGQRSPERPTHLPTSAPNASTAATATARMLTGMEKLTPIKRHNSTSSSGSSQRSAKKRSSWRYLLTPSYKSRSVEFNKLFCDTIPKNERLIADYACALHREILIQGRVYISVNYVAFYSNLFGWITKLTHRLRDVVEICKANTVRIIPNAIQIVTKGGEKRVFASFVQRDKSYMMMLRIWQNNLMKERMSDQEIRNLLYFSYGNDLGIGDGEEFKINSPDPVTPANVTPLGATDAARQQKVDRNNNSSQENSFDSTIELLGEDRPLACVDETSPDLSPHLRRYSLETAKNLHRQTSDSHYPFVHHTRYNSLDYQGSFNRSGIASELASRLNAIQYAYNPATDQQEANSAGDLTYSPAVSSPVIVDTPLGVRTRLECATPNPFRDHNDTNDTQLVNDQVAGSSEHHLTNKRDSLGASSTDTQVPSDHEAGPERPPPPPPVDYIETLDMRIINNEEGHHDDLTTCCGCGEHRGQLVADQEFDINIDTLFNLIFTNSKFMRAHMIKRGMTNTTIGGWRGSSSSNTNATGDRSSSSTLSADGRSLSEANALSSSAALTARQQQSVKRKQVRQLNYSVSIDHLWAKQVQVEEKQNICQAKPGVYVLKSQSINSGIPYAKTFTVDVVYCLTRCGPINKSRMLVHASVNFKQKQANWKLSMVKPMIERQSMQGVRDFIGDLTEAIKEYISETLVANNKQAIGQQQQQQQANDLFKRSNSLARAKSKLKERKLKNIYKYYIHNNCNEDNGGGDDEHEDIERGVLRRNSVSLSDIAYDDDEVDHYISDGTTDTGSSLMSLADDDDTASMMMMMRATTDDQVSDGATSIADFQQRELQHDKSFSDVNMSRRSSVCRDFRVNANNRHRSGGRSTSSGQYMRESWSMQRKHRIKSRRSPRCASGSNSANCDATLSLRRYLTDFSGRLGVRVSSGTITSGAIIALLVVILLAMFTQHVMLVRRFDLLERRLELRREQQPQETTRQFITGQK